MNLEDRFWSKVDIKEKDDCWEWKASITKTTGYGKFSFSKIKKIDSHRVVWFLIYGEFPELLVCHTCDNKLCCNPNHLFLGTYQDNVDDMISKGRQATGCKSGRVKHPEKFPIGEKHCFSKLKNKQIKQIRKRLLNGESCEKISKNYPVSPRAIREIKYGNTWKSVE